MIIYFLRHADAEDFVDSDFTRKLTPKGHDQAERVGKFCKQNGIKPEVFLTSPLVRARETAEIVGKKIGAEPVIADWLACGMTPETLIAQLEPLTTKSSALLVGHERERTYLESHAATSRTSTAAVVAPALWLGREDSLPILAALIADSALFLGNDTGAMHLAAALDVPIVAIFGGGTWPRFTPTARRGLVLVQPLPCFGCGWDCAFGDTVNPQHIQQPRKDSNEGRVSQGVLNIKRHLQRETE